MKIAPLDLSAPEVWRRLGHLRHGVFLDSASAAPGDDRWSLVMADPVEILRGDGRRASLQTRDGTMEFEGNPWEAIDVFTTRIFSARPSAFPGWPEAAGCGLIAGCLGYELGGALERLPAERRKVLPQPDFWLAFYDTVFVFDHAQNRGWLVSSGREGAGAGSPGRAARRLDEFIDEIESDVVPFPAPGERGGAVRPLDWKPQIDKDEYFCLVRKIREYIRAGDIYQANLTYPFLAGRSGDPRRLYEALRVSNPAPYAAFVDGGDFQVLSSSPEEFLLVHGREARTRPIKGTCARLGDPKADWERGRELLASAKNRAELLMITDLLRNDMGRIAEFGTVCVPELVRCEEYSTVYHLVSTVTAHLRRGILPWEALAACFPGGSITGAPKLRAQEIIHECERFARGLYTGAIGCFGPGLAHWNIAIRTMVCSGGGAAFSVGGAITADSDPADEFQETLAKARGLLRVGSSSVHEAGKEVRHAGVP